VLDNYYPAITLLITIEHQLLFSIVFSLKFDKLTGRSLFSVKHERQPLLIPGPFQTSQGAQISILFAIITLAFSGHHNAHQIIDSLFIMLWGVYLSGLLLFRIIKTGKDDRFDDKRDKFSLSLGSRSPR
jgi:Protein of unknown function (DUF1295)